MAKIPAILENAKINVELRTEMWNPIPEIANKKAENIQRTMKIRKE